MKQPPAEPQRQQLAGLLQQGYAALQRNDIPIASDCCRRVLQAQPDLVQGHFLVGLIALQARDRKTAFSAFGSVTRLQPEHEAAWAQLAKLFMSDGQVTRADAALAKATARPTRDPMVNELVAATCAMMGEHERATEHYQRAMHARPEHIPFTVNYANSLVYHGRNEEAAGLLELVLARDPANPQAHWILAGARRATEQQHIERMQAALPQHEGNDRALAFLYYAIGKEAEDLGEWDFAFEAFARGAAARRKTIEYDEPAEMAFYATLERELTPEWLAGGEPGADSSAPIFVLGQPRTGTTLIERIISSHSQVHSAGELQQFGFAIRRLSRFPEPRRFSAELLNAALDVEPRALGEMYLRSGSKLHGDTPRFVDKLPTNFAYIPLILRALPNAKIVHLQRDPMDACFASFKQLFADAYLHSYEQTEMARHHARYHRLMDTWRDRFPGRFLDISYEDTVSDLEPNARRLIDYLGLPWEEACLSFHEQTTAVSTASAAQVREPVHTRSVGRWRRYAEQLEPLRRALTAEGILPPTGP